jgi:hypothetical protein
MFWGWEKRSALTTPGPACRSQHLVTAGTLALFQQNKGICPVCYSGCSNRSPAMGLAGKIMAVIESSQAHSHPTLLSHTKTTSELHFLTTLHQLS